MTPRLGDTYGSRPKDRIFLRNNLEKLQTTRQEKSLPPALGSLSIIIIIFFKNLSSLPLFKPPAVCFFKIITVLFFFFPASAISAVEPLDVVINEISWMGTKVSYSDEWIELYNNKNEIVSLDGWVLKAEDETPKIFLTGEIIAFGFYILERTDDNTLPNISADKIYTGSLENAGEFLKLLDGSGNLIDSINCSDGWFAGDNSSKQTMERKNPKLSGNDPGNWQTSRDSEGTPKMLNNEGKITDDNRKELSESPQDSNVETTTEKEISKSYPAGIVINEILPSPEGPDEQNEWIEIFNQNDFEVNLFGWKIKDGVGKITSYTFPEETIIKTKGFLVLYRPVTKIVLNNDEDKLILLKPNGEIADEVFYQKASRGQSFNRSDSDWLWSSNLTPGSVNNIDDIFSLKESKQKEEKSAEFISEASIQKTGTINEKVLKNKNPLSVLFIALIIAFFSGTIFFFLKKSVVSKKDPEG